MALQHPAIIAGMESKGQRGIVLAVPLLFYGLVLLFSFHEADEDLWGRLASGRLALELGHVPERDVFAFVPTKPLWVDHEWLSGVVFHAVQESSGDAGLVLLRAALGVAAMALVLAACRAKSPWTVAFLALASWPLVAQGFNSVVRAQAFTFFFFGAFLYVLERGWRPWALVPLTALWANLHGGFVVGPILVLLHHRRLASARLAFLCLAASLVNPYGLDYWGYLAGALYMPRPEIVEWRAVRLADLHIVGGALLAFLVAARERMERFPLLTLLGALAAALLHVRFAPFLGMAMVLALPRPLESIFEKRRSVLALGATVLALGLALVGAASSFVHRDFALAVRVPSDRFPVEAVERLKREPAGNVAVFFNWGEYVLYHLYPDHLVSIDGRYETVYPEPVVRENLDFTRGAPGSEAFLDAYGAGYALYPRESGAARLLAEAAGWTLFDGSALFVLYRRK
jgi:hypothetical protein